MNLKGQQLAGIVIFQKSAFLMTFFSLYLPSGFCHSSESADIALSGAMRGAGPVQGAHDGAVRLPKVQLSVQKGQQVRALLWQLRVDRFV